MLRQSRTAELIKRSATIICLSASLLAAACGAPVPSDFPAFDLTNSPDTDGTN